MQKKLFEKKKSDTKSSDEVAYEYIQGSIDRPGLALNLQLKNACTWFRVAYEQKYSKHMIGYNIFHCQKVMKQVCENYSLTLFELCTLVNKWFTTYEELEYDDGNGFTLSCLNTQWLIQNLMNDVPNYKNKKKSHLKQSVSRRESDLSNKITGEKF